MKTADVIALAGVIVAIIALIPSFGQWLSKKSENNATTYVIQQPTYSPNKSLEQYDFDVRLENLAKTLIDKIGSDQQSLSVCYYPFIPQAHKQADIISEKFISLIDTRVSILKQIELYQVNGENTVEDQWLFNHFMEEREVNAHIQKCNTLLIGKFTDFVSSSGFNKTLLRITLMLLDGRKYNVQMEWVNI